MKKFSISFATLLIILVTIRGSLVEKDTELQLKAENIVVEFVTNLVQGQLLETGDRVYLIQLSKYYNNSLVKEQIGWGISKHSRMYISGPWEEKQGLWFAEIAFLINKPKFLTIIYNETTNTINIIPSELDARYFTGSEFS